MQVSPAPPPSPGHLAYRHHQTTPSFPCAEDDDGMDGQGGGQTSKPHGNPYPRRGDIKKKIIKDWTSGGGGSDNTGGNGGGGGDAGTTAGGYAAGLACY